MDVDRCTAIIIAEPAEASVCVCGVSVLERLLRVLQRLGIPQVQILSLRAGEIEAQLTPRSWASRDIVATVRELHGATIPADVNGERALVLSCFCYDQRLLAVLLACAETTLLVDSNPPNALRTLTGDAHSCGAAIVARGWLTSATAELSFFERLRQAAERAAIATIDVDRLPSYVTSMRRHIRPFWFPAPGAARLADAENILLDAAQNGTLDIPARVHAPIETWIVRRLCRTRITPMQITLFTACVSALVTWLFVTGRFTAGVALALAVGVLDGLDGKQARVKIETTEIGKREHLLDYALEISWWIALALHFGRTGAVRNALPLVAVLIGADFIDQLARRVVKNHVGRNLDDVSPFDRAVRLIGGRRNIYIWMLAIGLLLRVPDQAFVALCWWGASTAAVHVLRAVWICSRPVPRMESAAH